MATPILPMSAERLADLRVRIDAYPQAVAELLAAHDYWRERACSGRAPSEDPFALDQSIADMCQGFDPVQAMAVSWSVMTAATGMTRESYYAQLVHMQAMADIRTASGYMASESRSRGARHRGYSEGAVTPPRRETAVDRAMSEARKWGLA